MSKFVLISGSTLTDFPILTSYVTRKFYNSKSKQAHNNIQYRLGADPGLGGGRGGGGTHDGVTGVGIPPAPVRGYGGGLQAPPSRVWSEVPELCTLCALCKLQNYVEFNSFLMAMQTVITHVLST